MNEEKTKILIPHHIAIIMDGNGRWAYERGLARKEGHRAGAESVRECVEGCIEAGVTYLTLFAFSAENWNRPPSEVNALMKLLEHFLKEKTPEIVQRNVRLHAVGRLEKLPKTCQRALEKTIQNTQKNTGLNLILALNYGGREDIVDGVKNVAREIEQGSIRPEDITTDFFNCHLSTKNYPDPDLLIRTSGEMRLSNFMLWQISYSEIIFSKKYWPDFHKADLQEAIAVYSTRNRRYGAL